MPKTLSFVEKLLKRVDRIDHETLKQYVVDLSDENQLFQQILDELTEGIVILNQQGQIEMINRRAGAWLGIDISKSAGKSLTDMLTDEHAEKFFRHQLKGNLARKTDPLHTLTPHELYLQIHFIPLNSSDHPRLLLILANETEGKRQEINMDRLARIETLVSLAAGVAHEIGNPLNSLSIHLQLLKREIENLPIARRKVIEKSVSAMIDEAGRLDRIVKNFLTAARKPPLRFRMDDIHRVLEDAIHFMEPSLREHRVKVFFRSDRKLPPFLMDDRRLYQAFINLIKNAIEAMPKGGDLKISVSHKDYLAVIRFQDEGSGISEKDLPHIFEAYYTTKEEGSGLGLMTVYNTISEHGGKIDVSSKSGRGTVFTLLLPIRKPKLQLPGKAA